MHRGDKVTGNAVRVPKPLQYSITRIEDERRLDGFVRPLVRLTSPLSGGTLGSVLRGDWLGHALHPMLTDIPIGCWTSSFVLDLCGGRRSRVASQRLIGLGLLAVVPTAAAGALDWHETTGDERRRVGVVHAFSNSVAALLYFASWRARRRGRQHVGVLFGAAAGLAATVGGHLGGHLSFGRHTGTGERGTDDIDLKPAEDHELDGLIGA